MWLDGLRILRALESHKWSGLSKALGLGFVAWGIETETGEEYEGLSVFGWEGSSIILLRTSLSVACH